MKRTTIIYIGMTVVGFGAACSLPVTGACDKPGMVLEHLPSTRASRLRRRALWPAIVAVMALIGAVGGTLLAQH